VKTSRQKNKKSSWAHTYAISPSFRWVKWGTVRASTTEGVLHSTLSSVLNLHLSWSDVLTSSPTVQLPRGVLALKCASGKAAHDQRATSRNCHHILFHDDGACDGNASIYGSEAATAGLYAMHIPSSIINKHAHVPVSCRHVRAEVRNPSISISPNTPRNHLPISNARWPETKKTDNAPP
jgi:hypothetical protein